MEFYELKNHNSPNSDKHCLPQNTVEIEQKSLFVLAEKICNDEKCRYPQLALRILMHVIAGIDAEGRVQINARLLSKEIKVNYDTVTKCLKYLREIEVLRLER